MSQSPRRAVIAATIGNALEWYDFILYALFSADIGHTFFPARTEAGSVLLAVATFGAGFVLRPLGALVLGAYADRSGRKSALTLIIAMMTASTALIVFTPGYRRIGLAAPVLIVLSRLMQGFSVGGELGSSTALLIESADKGRRGFYGSWQGASQSIASLFAAAGAGLAAALLAPDVLARWGWRLPFAAGLLIGPAGFYIRASVHESEALSATLHEAKAPLTALLRHHRVAVLRTIGVICLGTAATYILELNMPSYAHRELKLPSGDTFLSNIVADIVAIALAPLAGHLSDKFGARRLMLPAACVLGLGVLPSFVLLTRFPHTLVLIAVQVIGLGALAFYTSPAYGLIGSLFPAQVRSSGLSVGYNVSVLAFGGFAPFVTDWLIGITGDRHMPGLYVTAGAIVTLAALTLAWPRGQRLPAEARAVTT